MNVAPLLTPSEQQQAHQMVSNSARRHFSVSRAALRLLLARSSGVPLCALRLSVKRYGKLVMEPPRGYRSLYFNLSHCNQWVLFAFSYRYQLGIDIEAQRAIKSPTTIAAHLGHALIPLSNQQVLRCWTRTEAAVKAQGGSIMWGGWGLPFDTRPGTFRVRIPRRFRVPLRLRASLYMHDLPLHQKWYGTLAIQGARFVPAIRYWVFDSVATSLPYSGEC